MKILIVSHSAVHMRQILFYEALSKFAEVIAGGPHSWRNLTMNSVVKENFRYIGLACTNEGNMVEYVLPDFDDVVERMKPDLIYAQCEPYSRMANIAFMVARGNNLPFVIFTWENIHKFENHGINRLLDNSDGIICGNNDAYKLILTNERKSRMTILPQVGISLQHFKPTNAVKTVKVLYVGRNTAEKGVNIIHDVCSKIRINFKIVSNVEYLELPAVYNEAEIFASLPVETKSWKEQSGSYTNLEAMACGLPVITTVCGAIPEYLEDAPVYIRQNGTVNPDTFEKNVLLLLQNNSYYQTRKELSLEQAKKYSNEKIAEKLFAALNRAF